MAGKVLEASVIKILIALRDPIILFNVITSWMTFAVLNRPVAATVQAETTAKEGDGFIWWTSLIMSIFITILIGLVFAKYVLA
jgi:uncharacterized membrane-anchored protein